MNYNICIYICFDMILYLNIEEWIYFKLILLTIMIKAKVKSTLLIYVYIKSKYRFGLRKMFPLSLKSRGMIV